jgi:hypothetical protein
MDFQISARVYGGDSLGDKHSSASARGAKAVCAATCCRIAAL